MHTVQGGLGNVIRHYKSGDYRLAKESLDSTSEQSVQSAIRDKSFQKELKSIGVRKPSGCCFSKPYTVYAVQLELGSLIDGKLGSADASQERSGSRVSPQPATASGMSNADRLRRQLDDDTARNAGDLSRTRDEGAARFEDVGLRNRINEQSLDHQVNKQTTVRAITETEMDQRRIHVEAMRARQQQLDAQNVALSDLNMRRAALGD